MRTIVIGTLAMGLANPSWAGGDECAKAAASEWAEHVARIEKSPCCADVYRQALGVPFHPWVAYAPPMEVAALPELVGPALAPADCSGC